MLFRTEFSMYFSFSFFLSASLLIPGVPKQAPSGRVGICRAAVVFPDLQADDFRHPLDKQVWTSTSVWCFLRGWASDVFCVRESFSFQIACSIRIFFLFVGCINKFNWVLAIDDSRCLAVTNYPPRRASAPVSFSGFYLEVIKIFFWFRLLFSEFKLEKMTSREL